MTNDTNDLCKHTEIRLIAAAIGHQQCKQADGTETLIPGTGKRILIGDDAYLARVAVPAAAEQPMTGDLPPLPMPLDEVDVWLPNNGGALETEGCEAYDNYFSADQMRDYARAAIAAHIARQSQAGVQAVPAGDYLPKRDVADEIVLLSNVMRHHPQLKLVIGREALLMRCVRAALAAPVAHEATQGRIESIANNADAMIILTQSYPPEAVVAVVDAHTKRQVTAFCMMKASTPASVENARNAAPDAKLVDALKSIKQMTNADDSESYRCDDREGCLDAVFSVASEALRTTTTDTGSAA